MEELHHQQIVNFKEGEVDWKYDQIVGCFEFIFSKNSEQAKFSQQFIEEFMAFSFLSLYGSVGEVPLKCDVQLLDVNILESYCQIATSNTKYFKELWRALTFVSAFQGTQLRVRLESIKAKKKVY